MKRTQNIAISLVAGMIVSALIMASCQPDWNNYYDEPGTSKQSMWEVIRENPEFSRYVELMKENSLDTIFEKDQSYTLFIPDNTSIELFDQENLSMDRVLGYHILNTVLISSSITGSRIIQTLFEKYALIEKHGNEYFFDGILLSDPSSLYADGIFYKISEVAVPKPTLLEYMQFYVPVFAEYIENQDSVGFDPFNSVPVGFDDDGNTIYDSVFTSINLFERDYYPVSSESRDNVATFILFSQEQYDLALDEMAMNLGGTFTDHEDIPYSWQNSLLLPYLTERGVFNDALQYSDFSKPALRNIRGIDVTLDFENIDPEYRFICSNGVVFNYLDLQVPLSLYKDTLRFEGEDLVRVPFGTETYVWKDDVTASDYSVIPTVLTSDDASNGAYLSVALPRNSTELYSVSFTFRNVFPSDYQFVYRAKARPSGVIKFYVNGEALGSVDNSRFNRTVDGNPSEADFNFKSFSLGTLTEYSDVNIKVEYTGPGILSNNGLCIDYIGLIPSDDSN